MCLQISQLRKEKGFSQTVAAKELGITKDYLSMIERGVRRPSTKLMEKMACAYGCKAEEIFLTTIRT